MRAEPPSELSPAIILAGGFGTRLRGAVPDGIPKPLAPVAGKPFLEHIIRQLTSAGVKRIVLSTGYAAEKIEEHFGDGSAFGAQIGYSREDAPLGTGGAAALAAKTHLAGREACIVMNGDSYCEVDFHALNEQHQAKNARALIVVRQVEDVSRYGSVEINDATGEIKSFREKATPLSSVSGGTSSAPIMGERKENFGSGWINGGIYLLSTEALLAVPERQAVSIEREVFPLLVGRGLYAFKTSGLFIDIGIPEELERAQGLF